MNYSQCTQVKALIKQACHAAHFEEVVDETAINLLLNGLLLDNTKTIAEVPSFQNTDHLKVFMTRSA